MTANFFKTYRVGDTFLNNNGESYDILEIHPDIDYALFFNKNNSVTPFVAAWNPGQHSWSQGHYFKTLAEACEYIANKKLN